MLKSLKLDRNHWTLKLGQNSSERLLHLPEWTFDRKRIENVFPLTLTLILTLNLTLALNLAQTLTLKHNNLFEKTKWRHFSGKCPDTFLTSYRGRQKLIGHKDFTFVEQPSRDAAWRRYVYKRRKVTQSKGHGNEVNIFSMCVIFYLFSKISAPCCCFFCKSRLLP